MAAELASLSPAQLAEIPLMAPPKGYVSNFNNPGIDGDLRPTVVGLNTFFTVLIIVCMSLRIYCRKCITKAFAYDDVFAIMATIGALAMYSSGVAGAYYGELLAISISPLSDHGLSNSQRHT